jgi:hypothetical protein
MLQIACELQASTHRLVRQNAELERRLAGDIHADRTSEQVPHHNEDDDGDGESSSALQRRVKSMGKKFCVMYVLWVDELASAVKSPLLGTYNPKSRFKTQVSRRQGILQDLRAALPDEMHEYITKEWFVSDVRRH